LDRRIDRLYLARSAALMRWVARTLMLLMTNFPAPPLTKDGIKPFPSTGARTLNSRTAFFYAYTGITPALIMRLPESE
jgi:hypothetical protein